MEFDALQERYGRDEYYWGTEPNELAQTTLEFVPDAEPVRALDIGAGEGRDAVFFAEHGFDVRAVDTVPNGLEKAQRLADERGVSISTRRADVNDLDVTEPVDLLYSCGTIQYLRPELRSDQFDQFKRRTNPDGIHALFAFVDHSDVETAPDWGESEHFYGPDELESYYPGWDVCFARDYVFDDESDGVPHRHAATELVVRKPE